MKDEAAVRRERKTCQDQLKRIPYREGDLNDISRAELVGAIRTCSWVLGEDSSNIPPQYYGTDDVEEGERRHREAIRKIEQKFRRMNRIEFEDDKRFRLKGGTGLGTQMPQS